MAFARSALDMGCRPPRRFVARPGRVVGYCWTEWTLCRRRHRSDRNAHADGHSHPGRAGTTHRYGDASADADHQLYSAAYRHSDAHVDADCHAHRDADADTDAYTVPGADFHS